MGRAQEMKDARGDLLLSLSSRTHDERKQSEPVDGGVFECKTCNRRFASFQALGGHRTSHSRTKAGGEEIDVAKKKVSHVHECSICGSTFSMGQALGGHMRRHRGLQRTQPEDRNLNLNLNLNLSPSGDTSDCRLLQLFV